MSAPRDDHGFDDDQRDRPASDAVGSAFDVRAMLDGADIVLGDGDELVLDEVVLDEVVFDDEVFDDEVVELDEPAIDDDLASSVGGDAGRGARAGVATDRRDGSAPPAGAVPGRRHEARERALHLLYEAEVKGVPVTTVLADLPLAPDPFAVELIEGLGGHGDEIDALVAGHSHRWQLDRMPALDRAVLRLAAYELAHRPDVPTAVVIDEAVELAKQYSTDRSGGFVNGVLSAVAADVRPA